MKYIFRQEEKRDYKNAETVIREAFWNKFQPGCDEHYLLHIMRDSENFIPELAFVAEDNGKIIGGIYYVESKLKLENQTELTVLEFGPLGVLPEYQKKGVGASLIGITKQIALKLDYKSIFITGEYNYYKLFGFKRAKDCGIKYGNDFFEPLLCYELEKDFLKDKKGSFLENSIYIIDKAKANIFNTSFPKKEKLVLPTQIFDENGNYID